MKKQETKREQSLAEQIEEAMAKARREITECIETIHEIEGNPSEPWINRQISQAKENGYKDGDIEIEIKYKTDLIESDGIRIQSEVTVYLTDQYDTVVGTSGREDTYRTGIMKPKEWNETIHRIIEIVMETKGAMFMRTEEFEEEQEELQKKHRAEAQRMLDESNAMKRWMRAWDKAGNLVGETTVNMTAKQWIRLNQ